MPESAFAVPTFLIRHARYFVLQLAESYLTERDETMVLSRKSRLESNFHPNKERASIMVKVSYDREHNTVIIEFEGNVDAAQAKQFFSDLEKVRPKPGKDFTLLTDFSLVDTMELLSPA
jgi:hypothetical protein